MTKVTNADPINLGSAEVISIHDLAKKIVARAPTGPQGTRRYCADTIKMKKTLQWSPKVTLNEGLKRTYRWAEKKLVRN